MTWCFLTIDDQVLPRCMYNYTRPKRVNCNYTPRFKEASVCLSVRLSVYGQNRVCSVSSIILIRPILYLHILSSNFRRCVACNACFEIKKNLIYDSMVWVIMRRLGYPQNVGVQKIINMINRVFLHDKWISMTCIEMMLLCSFKGKRVFTFSPTNLAFIRLRTSESIGRLHEQLIEYIQTHHLSYF